MIEIIILTVDRIEGKYAVCEDENSISCNIPLVFLPDGISEGDCFELNTVLRPDLVKDRKSKISKLFSMLKNKENKNEN